MSVNSVCRSFGQAAGSVSTSLSKVTGSLNKVALPAVALIALCNLPTADGGPLAYTTCIVGCLPAMGGFVGPAAVTCFQVCAFAILLPGP